MDEAGVVCGWSRWEDVDDAGGRQKWVGQRQHLMVWYWFALNCVLYFVWWAVRQCVSAVFQRGKYVLPCNTLHVSFIVLVECVKDFNVLHILMCCICQAFHCDKLCYCAHCVQDGKAQLVLLDHGRCKAMNNEWSEFCRHSSSLRAEVSITPFHCSSYYAHT